MIPPRWVDPADWYDDSYEQLLYDNLDHTGRLGPDRNVLRIYCSPASVLRYADEVRRVRLHEWPRYGFRYHRDIVESLVSAIHNGDPLPPILLYNGKLIDGYHRLSAALQCHVTTWLAFDVQFDPFITESKS